MSGSWWRSQVGASFCPPASLLPSCLLFATLFPSFLPSSLLLSLLPFILPSLLPPPASFPPSLQASSSHKTSTARCCSHSLRGSSQGHQGTAVPTTRGLKTYKNTSIYPFSTLFLPHKRTRGGARRAPELEVSQRGKWRKARGSSGLVTWKSSAAFETLGTPSGEEKASARLPRNFFFFLPKPQTLFPRGKGYF